MTCDRAARKDLAEKMLAAPDDHTLWLTLYDGPTPIVAVPDPEGDGVIITVSDKLGLHLKLAPALALRLSAHLAWAAMEQSMPPADEPAPEEEP